MSENIKLVFFCCCFLCHVDMYSTKQCQLVRCLIDKNLSFLLSIRTVVKEWVLGGGMTNHRVLIINFAKGI